MQLHLSSQFKLTIPGLRYSTACELIKEMLPGGEVEKNWAN